MCHWCLCKPAITWYANTGICMEAWSINSAATLDHTGLKHQSIYSWAILLWNEQHAHVSITCTMEWVVDLKNVSYSLKFCSLSHFLSLLYPTSGTFIIHFTGRPEKCNYITEELRVSSLCVVFFGREDGLYIWLEKNTGIINTWRWNSQMARWVPTAHILCLWSVHSIVPWFFCSVMYHLLNTTTVLCRMSMRPSTSHYCLAVNSCFHHSWLTLPQVPNNNFDPWFHTCLSKSVFHSQVGTLLAVQVKVHWSYYGSNDDKNEGLSIPKNGHHLWNTKLSIK